MSIEYILHDSGGDVEFSLVAEDNLFNLEIYSEGLGEIVSSNDLSMEDIKVIIKRMSDIIEEFDKSGSMNGYTESDILRAKEYYYHHIGYKESMFPYLWDQCSAAYKECWLSLAKIEIEDAVKAGYEMNEREYNNM